MKNVKFVLIGNEHNYAITCSNSFLIDCREEISRRLLKSKQTNDDEPDQPIKSKSQTYDNDIYAVDDDDDNRPSANRRKQINATKQKETEHSKSLQALVDERKKKQGNSTDFI